LPEEFPAIEHAALIGQEHIRKRVRKQRVRAGMWILYAGGLSNYNGYQLVKGIFAGKGWSWMSLMYFVSIALLLGVLYHEIRSYRRFRTQFHEHQKFFDLCPAIVQRILIIQDETRRKNLLHKMQLETEKRRRKVSP
jgi:hypothetical protein